MTKREQQKIREQNEALNRWMNRYLGEKEQAILTTLPSHCSWNPSIKVDAPQGLYKVHYWTHRGKHFAVCYSQLKSVMDELMRRWQARMVARAYDNTGNEVGAVWKKDGKLTWYCETEKQS